MATYFANVMLFDGRRVHERAGVLTSDGTIQWTGSHARAPREARAAVPVEGDGRTLTPGLIDCHVHLCFDGSAKIVATGGVLTPGVSVDFTAFTREEVEAAVDEAHKWGVPIAAHAIGRTGIGYCVAAGIDSIEHGAQIDAALAKEMKERGTFHVPT